MKVSLAQTPGWDIFFVFFGFWLALWAEITELISATPTLFLGKGKELVWPPYHIHEISGSLSGQLLFKDVTFP